MALQHISSNNCTVSVNSNERPSEGYKSSKPPSSSSSPHIGESSASSVTHQGISVSELKDALPTNNDTKVFRMASINDLVEAKYGITHIVEFTDLSAEQANAHLTGTGIKNLEIIVRYQDARQTVLWFVIDDIHLANDLVHFGDPCTTRFVPTEEALKFIGINKPYFKVPVANNKIVNIANNLGQVYVVLTQEPSVSPQQIHDAVVDLAKAYGTTTAIVFHDHFHGVNWQFIIEYETISSVIKFVKGLGLETNPVTTGISARVQPVVIEITPVTPAMRKPTRDVQTSATGRTTWVGDHLISQRGTPAQAAPARPLPYSGLFQGQADYGYGPMDPFTPSHPPAFGMGASRGHLSGMGRRRMHSRVSQDIEIMAIENGSDVRTTLMIRNLPHEHGFQDVKNALDLTSKGHYDFLYVRMDFGTGLNVGYAFVNFVRPEYIVPFVKARVSKRWPGVGLQKLLEVSYATIQGQDCLIQKFRNSSVMAEFASFRPKLLYTVDSNDIPAGMEPGDEAPFPPSDNRQKFTRSVDNAKTIGLYPPRGGKGGRDTRRPHTQYDRGTPGAIQDEVAYVQRTGRRFPLASYNAQVPTPIGHGPVARPDSGYHSAIPRYIPTLPPIDAMAGADEYYTPSRPAYGYQLGASAPRYTQW